jgi:methylenetetrahydrofolate reductase (NADPH)
MKGLAELLADSRLEVIPMGGIEGKVLGHVSTRTTLTVTCSPGKGPDATLDLAERLSEEGFDVHRRWKYLLIGAPTEERAAELAERIRADAPEDAEVHVEPSSVTHPAFVFLGAHRPGIARDLGL